MGVADGTNRDGVLLQQFQITIDGLLTIFGFPLLGRLGEGLLLGGIPVLVESSLDFISKTGSPDGLDGSWTVSGLDVTGDTNNLFIILDIVNK